MTGPPTTDQDQRLRVAVEKSLKASGRFRDHDLRCDVYNGEVTLRGRVTSWYCKQVAQQTAIEVPEVAIVHNLIEVIPISGDSVVADDG